MLETPIAWDALQDEGQPEGYEDMNYWEQERQTVIDTFSNMLKQVTGDGSKKRQAGEKPPWYEDDSHEAAIFSHLNKWKHGEVVDSDSGANPLVHLAWRALAIAYQETYGKVDPCQKPISQDQ